MPCKSEPQAQIIFPVFCPAGIAAFRRPFDGIPCLHWSSLTILVRLRLTASSLAGLYTLVSKSSSHQHRYSVSSTAQPAKLALEDGTIYQGTAIGSHGEIDGEVVFNTSMTGYQEILTDPSYRGQIVTMTYPLIGNYGVNEEDLESAKPQVAGFIVREDSRVRSNFRSSQSFQDYLKHHNIIAIAGIDTRALVRKTEPPEHCAVSSRQRTSMTSR